MKALKKILGELILFFQDPIKLVTPPNKNKSSVSVYYQYLVITLVLSLLIALTLGILVDIVAQIVGYKLFQNNSISQLIEQNSAFQNVLLIAILAPWIEEVAFRLILSVRRITFMAGLFSLFVFLITTLNSDSATQLRLTLWAVFLVGGLFFAIPEDNLNKWITNNFRSIVYLFGIIFASTHLLNYTGLVQFWYLSPLLISTQFFVGFFYAFLRVKFNLYLAFLCHGLYNGIILAVYYLTDGYNF